ncbi:MAG: hypothetical protein ACYC40_01755 [Patescibacteria group bacterium]
MEFNLRRRRRINEALFDYFVEENVISVDDFISDKAVVNKRILNRLAKELNCDSKSLRLSIKASCSRMLGISAGKILSKAEEEKVMLAASKHRITRSDEPLQNYKRTLGNLAVILNKKNPNPKIKTEELLQFDFLNG